MINLDVGSKSGVLQSLSSTMLGGNYFFVLLLLDFQGDVMAGQPTLPNVRRPEIAGLMIRAA